MIHKSIRESRELLYELKITEAATPSVATVHGEGSPSHRALVKKLSELTRNQLSVSTAAAGRLQPTAKASPGYQKFSGPDGDKVAGALQMLQNATKDQVDGATIKVTEWNKSDPSQSSSPKVGSGTFKCFRIEVKDAVPPLVDGIYVVPYKPLRNEKTGISVLETDQMLGYGAEWAVWFALNTGFANLNPDDPAAKLLINARLKTDLRLSGTFEIAGEPEVDSFKSKIESMKDALKENEALAGYSTKDTPLPKAGRDRVDVTAKNLDGVEISISVKYGGTERLGSATQVTTSGSSANIFQSVSNLWRVRRRGKEDPPLPDIATVQEALDKGSPTSLWYKALVSEAKEWLGLPPAADGNAKKYVIVQFPSVNSVKVTKPTGGDWAIQVKRGPVFGRAYIISVKKGDGKVIDDVLQVELRFTDSKYTQWHKGTGWLKLFPQMSESRQRKPRRAEASTMAGGAISGVQVPLGRGPDGKPATGDSKSKKKILSKNAKVQGQSWGNAKPLNLVKPIQETRNLLWELLFEAAPLTVGDVKTALKYAKGKKLDAAKSAFAKRAAQVGAKTFLSFVPGLGGLSDAIEAGADIKDIYDAASSLKAKDKKKNPVWDKLSIDPGSSSIVDDGVETQFLKDLSDKIEIMRDDEELPDVDTQLANYLKDKFDGSHIAKKS